MVPPPTLSGAEGEGDAAAPVGFGRAQTGAPGHAEPGEGSSSLSGSSGFPWEQAPPSWEQALRVCPCVRPVSRAPLSLAGPALGKAPSGAPSSASLSRVAIWRWCGFSAPSLYSRKLGTAGQKLGGAAVLCHIRHDPVDPGGPFTLTSANVGKCQTVLCRNGKPLPLSRSYVMSCKEELRRIKRHKAIVTEVRVVFLRLWGDWEEATELAGEHLPRRSVDAKADPRFQIRIHSI